VRSALTLRRAKLEDLDALVSIETAAFDCDRLSRRGLRYHILSQTTQPLVLLLQERLVGYGLVGYRRNSTRARLFALALDATAQGRGLGRCLLRAVERAAKAHGASMLGLEVRIDNTRAIALYEKAGYHRVGTAPDYYEDGATALRFEKQLG
jgi:ribosomal-protein-alanine N-acetyltransferase